MDFQQFLNYLLYGAVVVIGYLIVDIRNSINTRFKDHSDAIKELGEDFNRLKATLPRDYVMRDDFLRAISSLDCKVDRVATEVSDINKNLSKLIGGANREPT